MTRWRPGERLQLEWVRDVEATSVFSVWSKGMACQHKIPSNIVVNVATQLFEGRYRNGGRLESGTRRHADIASAEGHLSELS
jgi:hypothetical protein